jgi:hypothetical protein
MIFSDFYQITIFSTDFHRSPYISSFIQIRPDRRMDGQKDGPIDGHEANSRFSLIMRTHPKKDVNTMDYEIFIKRFCRKPSRETPTWQA